MLGRAGRPQRCHGIGKAQLGQCHHVHIAFCDQGVAHVAQGLPGLVKAVEFAPLVEDRGFGRVQVFGFFIAEHPPAKAYALALDIANREHEPVAEAVIAATVVLAHDDQPAFFELRVVVLGKYAGQTMPACRGIAQAKALGDFAGDAALFQILDGFRSCLELLAIGLAGFFQQITQCFRLLLLLSLALALGRTDVVLRHLQAALVGKLLHGFDKAHAGMLHQKADGIAILATAKAVKELLAGADGERGRLLAMERA